MEWLKSNWFLIVAVVTMSAAWGQQQQKVQTLEQAVVQQSDQAKKIEELRLQTTRQDEQLKSIERSQATSEQLLRAILESNRDISRKVGK